MSVLWAKILLTTGILSLVVVVLIAWHYQYYGIETIIIISLIGVSIFITGFIIIKNSKIKSRHKPSSNIEASCESMLTSNTNLNAVAVPLRDRNISLLSDDSMVLQQSHFSPQVVSAIIENSGKPRDSLIENNDVPPTYEEAKMLPTI